MPRKRSTAVLEVSEPSEPVTPAIVNGRKVEGIPVSAIVLDPWRFTNAFDELTARACFYRLRSGSCGMMIPRLEQRPDGKYSVLGFSAF